MRNVCQLCSPIMVSAHGLLLWLDSHKPCAVIRHLLNQNRKEKERTCAAGSSIVSGNAATSNARLIVRSQDDFYFAATFPFSTLWRWDAHASVFGLKSELPSTCFWTFFHWDSPSKSCRPQMNGFLVKLRRSAPGYIFHIYNNRQHAFYPLSQSPTSFSQFLRMKANSYRYISALLPPQQYERHAAQAASPLAHTSRQ